MKFETKIYNHAVRTGKHAQKNIQGCYVRENVIICPF